MSMLPPFSLIHCAIVKIKQDTLDVILITSWWPRQPWFTTLANGKGQNEITVVPQPSNVSEEISATSAYRVTETDFMEKNSTIKFIF